MHAIAEPRRRNGGRVVHRVWFTLPAQRANLAEFFGSDRATALGKAVLWLQGRLTSKVLADARALHRSGCEPLPSGRLASRLLAKPAGRRGE